MIRKFQIFENSLYKSFKDAEQDSSLDDEDEDVIFKDVIGIDPADYKSSDFKFYAEQKNYGDLSLFFTKSALEELMDVEEGVVDFALQFTGYNDYYYEVESSEVGYHTNDEGTVLINRLFKMLYLDVEVDPENIYDLFEALGDKNVNIYDITIEIDYEYTAAVEFNCKEALADLPFDLSSEYGNGDYNYEVVLDFDDIEKYIEKHKLEDVNTIKDLFEKSYFSEFDWSGMASPWETNYDMDFDKVCEEFNKAVNKIIEKLKEGSREPEYKDPLQLDMFKDLDEEVVKKAFKHSKSYNYQHDVFKTMKFSDLHHAKRVGGKVYAWFKSYEFQKNFISKNEEFEDKLKNYEKLESEEILHPAIEDEYDYLVAVGKYNL